MAPSRNGLTPAARRRSMPPAVPPALKLAAGLLISALLALLVAASPPLRAALVGLEPALAPLLVAAGLLAGVAGWWLRLRRGRRGWSAWRRRERGLLGPAVAWQALAALVFTAPLLAHMDGHPTGRIAAFAQQLGHLPWGDCNGHFAGANRLLAEGAFGGYSERRPMGAAWLSVTLAVTDERLPAALLLQCLLLGAAASLAARAAAARFGLGAPLILLGLVQGLSRDYLPTASTEPLGLMVACLAVTLLASRLARHSLAVTTAGVLALAVALNARPGAQLLLPALFLWGLAVAPRAARWRAAAVLGLAIAAASGLTGALNALHGAGEASFTTYPAYTFYGLTRDANYRQVAKDFPRELETLPEKELARFLYARGFENLKADPRPFLAALLGNTGKFLSKAPESVARAISPRWLLTPALARANPSLEETTGDSWAGGALLLLALAGFLVHLRQAASRAEAGFWLLFGAGLLLSATVVYGEAGFRSLTPAAPFLALAAAMAASAGRERRAGCDRRGDELLRLRVAGAATLALALLCLLGPYAARALHRGPTPQQAAAALAGAPEGAVATDLRRAPALIVVPFADGGERWPEVDYDLMRFLLDVGDFADERVLARQRAPFAVLSVYDIARQQQRLLVAPRALLREVSGPVTLQVEPLEGASDLAIVTGWTAW